MALLKNLLGGLFVAKTEGSRGYALLRAVGVPIPLLLAVYFYRKHRRARAMGGALDAAA